MLIGADALEKSGFPMPFAAAMILVLEQLHTTASVRAGQRPNYAQGEEAAFKPLTVKTKTTTFPSIVAGYIPSDQEVFGRAGSKDIPVGPDFDKMQLKITLRELKDGVDAGLYKATRKGDSIFFSSNEAVKGDEDLQSRLDYDKGHPKDKDHNKNGKYINKADIEFCIDLSSAVTPKYNIQNIQNSASRKSISRDGETKSHDGADNRTDDGIFSGLSKDQLDKLYKVEYKRPDQDDFQPLNLLTHQGHPVTGDADLLWIGANVDLARLLNKKNSSEEHSLNDLLNASDIKDRVRLLSNYMDIKTSFDGREATNNEIINTYNEISKFSETSGLIRPFEFLLINTINQQHNIKEEIKQQEYLRQIADMMDEKKQPQSQQIQFKAKAMNVLTTIEDVATRTEILLNVLNKVRSVIVANEPLTYDEIFKEILKSEIDSKFSKDHQKELQINLEKNRDLALEMIVSNSEGTKKSMLNNFVSSIENKGHQVQVLTQLANRLKEEKENGNTNTATSVFEKLDYLVQGYNKAKSLSESSSGESRKLTNNNIVQHAPENNNPGPPSDLNSGAMLHFYNGLSILTKDENELVAFVLKTDYLIEYSIVVHPRWNMDKWAPVIAKQLEMGQKDLINPETLTAYHAYVDSSKEDVKNLVKKLEAKIEASLDPDAVKLLAVITDKMQVRANEMKQDVQINEISNTEKNMSRIQALITLENVDTRASRESQKGILTFSKLVNEVGERKGTISDEEAERRVSVTLKNSTASISRMLESRRSTASTESQNDNDSRASFASTASITSTKSNETEMDPDRRRASDSAKSRIGDRRSAIVVLPNNATSDEDILKGRRGGVTASTSGLKSGVTPLIENANDNTPPTSAPTRRRGISN